VIKKRKNLLMQGKQFALAESYFGAEAAYLYKVA
jgi:hypothetical protein